MASILHNVVTGETTWDIPVELAAARMELAIGKTPEIDDADGRSQKY